MMSELGRETVSAYAAACGFFVIGFGCAPVYPCQIHDAAVRFRGTDTQTLIGVQMACAYLGTTLMPPLFGMLAVFTAELACPVMPWLLSFSAGAMLCVTAHELCPAARGKAGSLGYIGGFALMMALDVALG